MMTHVRIGATHKLDVSTEAHENVIDWVNQRSKKFFSLLKEIDGKKVLVRNRSRADLDRYIVSLIDMPQDTFYIEKKFLHLIVDDDAIPCSCDLNILVNRGCQCGAFQKENQRSKN